MQVSQNVRFAVDWVHRLRFTCDAFDPANPTLADVMAGEQGPVRVLPCIDQGVLDALPDLEQRLQDYFAAHSRQLTLAGPVVKVPGGEACKNDQMLQYRLCRAIHDARICRQSYVLVIGGGAVLDAVGFAAAISHRGVRLVRMPTTTLSQDDSGVGVKNSINAFGKKNFLGTFAVPWAVVNDELLLTRLSDRDFITGFSEAVKVALIKDAALYERIRADAGRIRRRDMAAAVPVIVRSAQLHLQHITSGGDPFEMTTARPLDFGHWAAHKLESMTMFELRHGEAVSIGIALDVVYASLAGLLHEADAAEILETLQMLGLPVHHEALQQADTLIQGLEEFREHLGGQLTVTMLTGIGKSINVHEVDHPIMRAAIERLGAYAGVASA